MLISANANAGNLYLDSIEKSVVTQKEFKKTKKLLMELKELKLIEKFHLNTYHKRMNRPEPLKKPFCLICHKNPPHSKNEKSRTFLNMHSRYVSCEVCHLKSEGKSLKYVMEKEGEKDNVKKMIIPYFNGEVTSLTIDHPYAKEVKEKWEKLPLDDKAHLKVKLHKPLKDKGPLCRDCHSKKSKIVDFKSLGYSAKRVRMFEQNKIADFLDKVKNKKKSIAITDLLNKK